MLSSVIENIFGIKLYSKDYVDGKYANLSCTESRANQESTKLKCVQNFPRLPVIIYFFPIFELSKYPKPGSKLQNFILKLLTLTVFGKNSESSGKLFVGIQSSIIGDQFLLGRFPKSSKMGAQTVYGRKRRGKEILSKKKESEDFSSKK